jgi:hypothetical protein
MRVQTLAFQKSTGWSANAVPSELDSPSTLLLVFGGPEPGAWEGAFRELMAVFPQAAVIGCSTAGEIFGTSILDGGLAVGICKFERTVLKTAIAEVTDASASRAAGNQIARALAAPDLRGALVLSDGVAVNGSELVRGLNDVLPPEVVVTGGLAGDGANFKRTWVIADRAPHSQRVTAVGFYGAHFSVGHGSQGGWDIFGVERRVTRSAGNVLFELDGKPALKLYKEYLGERAEGLPATALLFPLALRNADEPEKTLVRTILAVDEAAQSLTFAGDIPQGSRVQLMRANFDRLIDGASEAGRLAAGDSSKRAPDSLTLAVSCVGRRLVLGERAEEEIEAVRSTSPKGAELVGFYSYGEISPHTTGRCDLHNQTMTVTVLSET